MTILQRGLPAAPGIGIGTICIYRPHDMTLEAPLAEAPPRGLSPRREWQRFLHAQERVDTELARLGESLNHVAADIFSVHRLILADKTLTESIRSAIQLSGFSAVSATRQVILDMAQMFRELDDEYFAGRAADILDIGRRLLAHLGAPIGPSQLDELPPFTILLTDDLTPTDIATLPAENIAGIGLAYGTPTAHSSILARSLGFPLVCGLGPESLGLDRDLPAILDGYQGLLIVEPTAQQTDEYGADQARDLDQQAMALAHAHEPARTSDGTLIPVYINANTAEEVTAMGGSGADGIGLMRTEYLFQGRAEPPSVAEQQAIYSHFARQTDGRPLTVRALDAGGDKPVEYLMGPGEENPFLGLRGIRLLLANPGVLTDQFRALLLAAREQPADMVIRFMLPMISTIGELEEARTLLEEVRVTVEQANDGPAGARVEIGVLIEVPSAALLAERLAAVTDFLSVGTNDLAQYVLASDRTNSQVAGMADPLHPAVLQLIARTAYAAKIFNVPISLCGEIGGNVKAVPLLLGLGITELSVPLPAAPLVKQAVREADLFHCRQLAESALRCSCAEDVRALLTVS